MYLVRYNPTRDFVDVRSTMDRFFGDTFGRFFEDRGEGSGWSPAVDVEESENEIAFAVELPGFENKEIEISVEDGYLVLKGERKFEEKSSKYHRVERRYGKFLRSFQLPDTVNEEKISASLKNGVLRLTLPKREEVKPRQIPVAVS